MLKLLTFHSSPTPSRRTTPRIAALSSCSTTSPSNRLTLQSRGFDLDFKLSDDPKIGLQRYGQYTYDALILFSPIVDCFGGSIDLAAILDFVDTRHDLIITADTNASDLIRQISVECGVDFDEGEHALPEQFIHVYKDGRALKQLQSLTQQEGKLESFDGRLTVP